MYTSEALLDVHERCHRTLKKLIAHCRELSPEELDREMDGFGYPSVRLQLHHTIGAQQYWVGVLEGRIDVDDDDSAYPDIDTMEAYRQQIFSMTENYLRGASNEELNTPRKMMTWGNKEHDLTPAQVFMRTQTHIFMHQGQIQAQCRLIGKPAMRIDFPLD